MDKTHVNEQKNKKNIKQGEEVLNFIDYVFEIDGKDIKHAKVIYTFYNSESYSKNNWEIGETLINIEISGLDDNNKDTFISFLLHLDLETLNRFNNNKIEDITGYLDEIDTFIKKPNEDNPRFLMVDIPTNKKKDMFTSLTSLYVFKVAENNFIFKLTVPNENIFTYFEIHFQK